MEGMKSALATTVIQTHFNVSGPTGGPPMRSESSCCSHFSRSDVLSFTGAVILTNTRRNTAGSAEIRESCVAQSARFVGGVVQTQPTRGPSVNTI